MNPKKPTLQHSTTPPPRPKKKNPHAVALGRLGGLIGGKITGPSKARPSHVARAAVRARWDKYYAAQKTKPNPTAQPKPRKT